MQRAILRLFLFCLLSFLQGCQSQRTHPLPFSTQKVIAESQQQGFAKTLYRTPTFVLTVFEKEIDPTIEDIHVYIEGDGNSWKTRYVLSDNPTPKKPLALQLALRDTHPNVMYIARPCQYTPHQDDSLCHSRFWSSHRYAPEVIDAVNDVLNQVKANYPRATFALLGFSGGASVAVLVAAKRNDIRCLVTVAGDLNHVALNEYHRTTPLSGSLNPMSVASGLKTLPQYHFCGEADKVVPPFIAETFANAVNSPSTVHVYKLPGVKHHQGWLAPSNTNCILMHLHLNKTTD